jgi:hypothetical protein
MVFWLVLKVEISYRVIISSQFWFLLEDFLKIIFLHGDIFEILQFFFCLKILFNVNGKATMLPTFSFIAKFGQNLGKK